MLHPPDILVSVGCVDDDEKPILRLAIDDQVVDRAAIFLAHLAVHGMPRFDRRDIVGEQSLQVSLGPGALDPHPPHVRDVEQTGRPADGEVLIADRAVLLGHLPTAEVDHAPTERDVSVVEWRALQGAIRRQPFRLSRWRRDR